MELKGLFRSLLLLITYILLLALVSCGPIVISSRTSQPPPPWFYPNRLEMVRYVYFPEYNFYYDLAANSYLYLDGGMWMRRSSPPPQYRNINLSRSRYERVRNYSDDTIKKYHDEHNVNRRRTTRNNTPSRTSRNNA